MLSCDVSFQKETCVFEQTREMKGNISFEMFLCSYFFMYKAHIIFTYMQKNKIFELKIALGMVLFHVIHILLSFSYLNYIFLFIFLKTQINQIHAPFFLNIFTLNLEDIQLLYSCNTINILECWCNIHMYMYIFVCVYIHFIPHIN